MANWPPPMGKWPDRQTGIKHDFAFLFFTFLLLLPREIVLEREHTMADEEHFFLPTSQSEYAWRTDGQPLLDGVEEAQDHWKRNFVGFLADLSLERGKLPSLQCQVEANYLHAR